MLSRIGSRSDTADSALIAESRTIWNGTTEQASVSPTASPDAVEDHPQQQVDADEGERVDEPLDDLPDAAPVADPQVAARERDEDVQATGQRSAVGRSRRADHVQGLHMS